MITTTYNLDFFGRKLNDQKKGSYRPEDPAYNHKFEPSMTDQTFNYSIASKVEDFIAAGQVISAIAENANYHEVNPENRIDSFYGDDLPVVQQRIRQEADRISKLLEDEKIEKDKKKEYEALLQTLRSV